MTTVSKILFQIANIARKQGYPVAKTRRGGGWLKIAKACGLEVRTKREAKAKLLAKYNFAPIAEKPRTQKREWKPRDRNAEFVVSDLFLASYEWRRVRMMVLKRDGARCACCGATPADGLRMHVDHIKPRKLFPHLALDVANLQVLCEECNHGKGNWDQTDWRYEVPANDDAAQHLRAIAKEK